MKDGQGSAGRAEEPQGQLAMHLSKAAPRAQGVPQPTPAPPPSAAPSPSSAAATASEVVVAKDVVAGSETSAPPPGASADASDVASRGNSVDGRRRLLPTLVASESASPSQPGSPCSSCTADVATVASKRLLRRGEVEKPARPTPVPGCTPPPPPPPPPLPAGAAAANANASAVHEPFSSDYYQTNAHVDGDARTPDTLSGRLHVMAAQLFPMAQLQVVLRWWERRRQRASHRFGGRGGPHDGGGERRGVGQGGSALDDDDDDAGRDDVADVDARLRLDSVQLSGDEDPRKWPGYVKWTNTAIISLMGFASPMGSSVVVSSSLFIDREFRLHSRIASLLPVSSFVLGLGVGPFVLAPASELRGRQAIYFWSSVLFTAFNAAAAAVDSFAGLIACRFLAGAFGSSGPSLGAGSIGDMFVPAERGRAQSLYGLGPLLGPVCGTIAGGWIAQELRSWRWPLWVLTIFSGAICVVIAVMLRETFAPVLLRRKRERLARERIHTLDSSRHAALREVQEERLALLHFLGEADVVHAHGGAPPPTTASSRLSRATSRLLRRLTPSHEAKVKVKLAFTRPSRLLFTNPICAIFSLYMGYVYGIIFLFLTQHPLLYQRREDDDDAPRPEKLHTYGWNPGPASLTYIGLGLGFLTAALLNVLLQDAIYRRLVASEGSLGWFLFCKPREIERRLAIEQARDDDRHGDEEKRGARGVLAAKPLQAMVVRHRSGRDGKEDVGSKADALAAAAELDATEADAAKHAPARCHPRGSSVPADGTPAGDLRPSERTASPSPSPWPSPSPPPRPPTVAGRLDRSLCASFGSESGVASPTTVRPSVDDLSTSVSMDDDVGMAAPSTPTATTPPSQPPRVVASVATQPPLTPPSPPPLPRPNSPSSAMDDVRQSVSGTISQPMAAPSPSPWSSSSALDPPSPDLKSQLGLYDEKAKAGQQALPLPPGQPMSLLGAAAAASAARPTGVAPARASSGAEPKRGRPEYRLPLCLAGMVILPAGLLVFGWAAQSRVHWAVPLVGSYLVGMGAILPFQTILVYLVDAFFPFSASATACAVLVRCVLAAVFPLFAQRLFEELGYGVGSTLLAAVSAMAIPVPLLLWRYGEPLRLRFKFNG